MKFPLTRTVKLMVCAAGLPLALAACSSGESEAGDAAATTEPAAAAGNNDMTPQAIDIVEVASANDNLSTFLQAALQANLAETLANTQGLTVFAPINTAFDSVDDLDAIRADQQRLSELLQLHVVPTAYSFADIPDGDTSVETLAGETLTIRKQDGQIVVIDPSGAETRVVQADIEGDNGVVHAINTVLTAG